MDILRGRKIFMNSIVPTSLSSNVRLALVLVSITMASPAWSLGHWGYCKTTETRDEPADMRILHYYSEVAVINANNSNDVERKFGEFMKRNYFKDANSLSPTVCHIDFDTAPEAEAHRAESMSRDKDHKDTHGVIWRTVEVTFVYTAN
jgi:hypothetical protein